MNLKPIILIITLLTYSCISQKIDRQNFTKVNFNTTESQALFLLGQPLSKGLDEARAFESIIWQDNVHGCKTAIKLTWIYQKVDSITYWSSFEKEKNWQTVELLTKSKQDDWIKQGVNNYSNAHINLSLEFTEAYFHLEKLKKRKTP